MIISAIIDAVVGKAVERVGSTIADRLGREVTRLDVMDADALARTLRHHLIEAANWSGSVQVFGMSKYEPTDVVTVPVTLSSEPRRFGSRDMLTLEESALLADDRSYVVLGEPGAGKTTTVKRLVRRLLDEDTATTDYFNFPLVLRLRELTPGATLTISIADLLGLRYEFDTAGATRGYWFGDVRLEAAVAAFLSAMHAVVLLDGLDEVTADGRSAREAEIVTLNRAVDEAKVIVTCRSGDYIRQLDRFDVVEIRPLTRDQIEIVAAKWLSNAQAFLTAMRDLPYRDVADRPLLLMQLMVLYRRYGELPEQPSYIYKRLIELLLREWDAERDIHRLSKYAGFEPARKAEFLSALSYHLTYVTKTKTFTTANLEAAYVALYEQFRLPVNEARRVAGEIQTHTGLVVQIADDLYEFSHLSLQEYLCASYLVRDPFGEHFGTYVKEYPAPVAVAVALAADPSRWFAVLVLRCWWQMTSTTAGSLLARVMTERPAFGTSWLLGAALMKLFCHFERDVKLTALLDRLATHQYVRESLKEALAYYVQSERKESHVAFVLQPHPKQTYGVEIPKTGCLSHTTYALVAAV